MKHRWLAKINRVGGNVVLLLAQVAIAGIVFYLAFGFLFSVAEALLAFLGLSDLSPALKLAVAIGVFGIFGVVLAFTFLASSSRVTKSLDSIANAFLQQVAESNLSEAYGFTSKSFQADMPRLAFFQFVQAQLPQDYKKTVWEDPLTRGDRATLKGVIYTDHEQLVVKINFIYEDEVWRIDQLHLADAG
jgi:hypothetical protein